MNTSSYYIIISLSLVASNRHFYLNMTKFTIIKIMLTTQLKAQVPLLQPARNPDDCQFLSHFLKIFKPKINQWSYWTKTYSSNAHEKKQNVNKFLEVIQ